MTASRPGLIATLLAILIAIFLMMPLLAVVPVSFTPKRFLSIPTDELSLRHYRALVENPAWAGGIWLSIRIGMTSASIATALGAMFSLGIWMLRPRFAGMLMGIALLPMVAPPVVSALTLYFFLITIGQFNTVVAFGHTGRCGVGSYHHDCAFCSSHDLGVTSPGRSANRSGGTVHGCKSVYTNIQRNHTQYSIWLDHHVLPDVCDVMGRNCRHHICHIRGCGDFTALDVDGSARQY